MKRALSKELKEWKREDVRYPILLRGARQVGKTYLVEQFAAQEFETLASVNFEAQPEAIACFDSLEPSAILARLELILGVEIRAGKTLLFLDEIQACPKAIAALRYFKEKRPDLHVIGAGSLLEFTLAQGKFSFPVGRVQFLYLKPLSFQEYLMARAPASLEAIQTASLQMPPNEEIHKMLLHLVTEYFLIGGMPAVVSDFCKNQSWLSSLKIQDILLSTYRADFGKYATETSQKYLKILFDAIPETVGTQFKYSKIDPHLRSRELKEALELLEWAGLIHLIFATSAGGIPLSTHIKRTLFKLLFLDIGLMQRALQVDPEVLFTQDVTTIHGGALAEQFVGQELLAYAKPHLEPLLFYWQRESSDAEVDYIWILDGEIIPIEVKAGRHGKLKSIRQFMKEKKSKIGVRISSHPLQFEDGILSIPFYMIASLPKLAREVLSRQ